MGKKYPENETYRQIIYQNYRILYKYIREEDKTIIIIVVHCSRQLRLKKKYFIVRSDYKFIENAIIEADKSGFDGAVLPDHYMWGKVPWLQRFFRFYKNEISEFEILEFII